MTQTEYEQNRAECWEYVSKTILTIGGSKEKRAFDYAFDRAYALGKLQASCRQVNKTISQKEIEKAALKYVFNRQKARHNAKNDEEAYLSDFDNTLKAWDAFDMAQAFEDGMKFALGKQEKDAETVICGWVARASDGHLALFKRKPDREIYMRSNNGLWFGGSMTELDSTSFPELTWDDDPIEVEIIIKRKKK